jgi:ribonuclease HII
MVYMSKRIPGQRPDLSRERRLWRRGYHKIAGLDEAGRGAWAGPLAAAAVVLPMENISLVRTRLCHVRDSKQMTPAARSVAAEQIRQIALAWAIGAASAAEVDQLGPLRATHLAMQRALQALPLPPDHLMIDYLLLPHSPHPQSAFVHGDACSLSIASASVLAKVWRDSILRELDSDFPGYGFAAHKGYGTRFHAEALARLGVSPEHRKTYAPVRSMLASHRDHAPF